MMPITAILGMKTELGSVYWLIARKLRAIPSTVRTGILLNQIHPSSHNDIGRLMYKENWNK